MEINAVAYLAVRRQRSYPLLLGVTNVIYAVPALTLFVVMGPWLGFTNDKPIIVAMTTETTANAAAIAPSTRIGVYRFIPRKRSLVAVDVS